MKEEKKVKKIIPSRLETGFQQFLYKNIGVHIPENMTPNQVTLIGALGGLFGIICALLVNISSYFFIGVIAGLLTHLIADDLDGYVARTRNMQSKSGAYFDLITDIIFITFLLIALSLSKYISIKIVILLVPVYPLIIVTAMHYILYLNEFLFPRLGPIETHLFFIFLCIGCMVFKDSSLLTIGSTNFKFSDIVIILGGIPMYYEMIRLQIQFFNRASKIDKESR